MDYQKIYFRYLLSFKRLLLINEKLITSKRIDENTYRKFICEALLPLAQNFGCTEQIKKIIFMQLQKPSEKIKEISPSYLLILASLYKISPSKIKEKVLSRMKKLLDNYLKVTQHPLKKAWILSTFTESIFQLYEFENYINKKKIALYIRNECLSRLEQIRRDIVSARQYDTIFNKIQSIISNLITEKKIPSEKYEKYKKLDEIKKEKDKVFFNEFLNIKKTDSKLSNDHLSLRNN